MGIAQYPQCIAKPINSENLVGEKLDDDPQFDFIEDEMMKVGSLSHSTVEWDKVEQTTVKLLSTQSKDIRLLAYLLQCLHAQPTPLKVITSFQIMKEFLSLYWLESYPIPGQKGKKLRSKLFEQMAQRFQMLTEKYDFSRLDDAQCKALLRAAEEWYQATVEQSIDSDAVDSVTRRIRLEISSIQERAKLTQAQTPPNPAVPVTSSNEVTQEPNIVVDHSSDKASKQTLLKVADFIGEQQSGMALSIRLRRFAVWESINSLPDHKPDGETMLRGMQSDRVKDYQDQMREPDHTLWRKVEQSLTLAPFWFDGQLMSYNIANHLGESQACIAIVEQTESFLQRMPSLLNLKFKGGTPFVSEQVQQWLEDVSPTQSSTSSAVGEGWDEIRKEALQIAEEKSLETALTMLNQGLTSAKETRDQFYWRLLTADILRTHDLGAMAEQHYQILNQQVSALSVPEWEPSLVEQIRKYTTSE